MPPHEFAALLKRIEAATGRDRDLDRVIARVLDGGEIGDETPDFTASVDQCLALIARILPGWHWHLGYGASGVFPYAAIAHGRFRVETGATTVPLALLAAAVKARIAQAGD